jgi:cytosine/adenosine deaminase-related metal-dependent hydrolase
MHKRTLLAKQLFTGNGCLSNHAVVIEQDKIVEIVPFNQTNPNVDPIYDIIAPAFLDIQIYDKTHYYHHLKNFRHYYMSNHPYSLNR